MAKRKPIRKGVLILAALLLSVILYVAGVYSGLNASKLLESKVNTDVTYLRGFIDNSALDIKNLQLQQLFIDSFETGNSRNKCTFLDLYVDHLYTQMGSYWDALPARLESYEQTHTPTDEYTALKREYIRFSLRYWLIARQDYEFCSNTKVVPLLYFYSKDCTNCVRQGEQFDLFTKDMQGYNKTVIVFPVDGDFPDDTTYLLKVYYNITAYPAIVWLDRPVQGRVFSGDEIKAMVQAQK